MQTKETNNKQSLVNYSHFVFFSAMRKNNTSLSNQIFVTVDVLSIFSTLFTMAFDLNDRIQHQIQCYAPFSILSVLMLFPWMHSVKLKWEKILLNGCFSTKSHQIEAHCKHRSAPSVSEEMQESVQTFFISLNEIWVKRNNKWINCPKKNIIFFFSSSSSMQSPTML